jgi:hypothetical protein
MKILSWNCRGLGNPTAVRALKKILRRHCPDLVFLMDTRLKATDSKAKSTLACGPLSNMFLIDCNTLNGHRSGGLAALWNDSVSVDVINANNTYIDMYLTSCNDLNSWYATGMYGYPYNSKKHLTCTAIKDIHQTRTNDKWLLW